MHRNNILIQKSQQYDHVTVKINSVTCASCWDFYIRNEIKLTCNDSQFNFHDPGNITYWNFLRRFRSLNTATTPATGRNVNIRTPPSEANVHKRPAMLPENIFQHPKLEVLIALLKRFQAWWEITLCQWVETDVSEDLAASTFKG